MERRYRESEKKIHMSPYVDDGDSAVDLPQDIIRQGGDLILIRRPTGVPGQYEYQPYYQHGGGQQNSFGQGHGGLHQQHQLGQQFGGQPLGGGQFGGQSGGQFGHQSGNQHQQQGYRGAASQVGDLSSRSGHHQSQNNSLFSGGQSRSNYGDQYAVPSGGGDYGQSISHNDSSSGRYGGGGGGGGDVRSIPVRSGGAGGGGGGANSYYNSSSNNNSSSTVGGGKFGGGVGGGAGGNAYASSPAFGYQSLDVLPRTTSLDPAIWANNQLDNFGPNSALKPDKDGDYSSSTTYTTRSYQFSEKKALKRTTNGATTHFDEYERKEQGHYS